MTGNERNLENQERALLIISDGSQVLQSWVLKDDVTTIGRWADNDVVIPDRWVSRHHALIRRQGRRYILEDCGSKNGTFLDGRRVTEPTVLEDGAVIQVAPTVRLTFVDRGATAPLPVGAEGVRLRVDPQERRVWVRGQELLPPLSPLQYRLLRLLAEQPGRIYTRREIIAAVWPEADPAGITDKAINAVVRRLRRRLAELDPDHEYIVTVRGHGFRLEQQTPEVS
mgnify:CR=1 FL=1